MNWNDVNITWQKVYGVLPCVREIILGRGSVFYQCINQTERLEVQREKRNWPEPIENKFTLGALGGGGGEKELVEGKESAAHSNFCKPAVSPLLTNGSHDKLQTNYLEGGMQKKKLHKNMRIRNSQDRYKSVHHSIKFAFFECSVWTWTEKSTSFSFFARCRILLSLRSTLPGKKIPQAKDRFRIVQVLQLLPVDNLLSTVVWGLN